MVVVVYNKDPVQVRAWLEEHVGKSITKFPVWQAIVHRGKGWYMKAGYSSRDDIMVSYISVDFIDSKNAVWFELVWG